MTQDNNEHTGTNDSTNASHLTDELSLDACLELLANRQRRLILEFFLNSPANHASVDQLVSELVKEEARITGERPGHDSMVASLFHVHLPKFAEAGLIEYDTRNLEIRYHDHPRIENVYAKIQELE